MFNQFLKINYFNFHIYKDPLYGYYFQFKSGNGPVLASSTYYEGKAQIMKAIQTIKDNMKDTDIIYYD